MCANVCGSTCCLLIRQPVGRLTCNESFALNLIIPFVCADIPRAARLGFFVAACLTLFCPPLNAVPAQNLMDNSFFLTKIKLLGSGPIWCRTFTVVFDACAYWLFRRFRKTKTHKICRASPDGLGILSASLAATTRDRKPVPARTTRSRTCARSDGTLGAGKEPDSVADVRVPRRL